MSLLDEIPGYAEAVAAEQASRELAFMPAPLPICGVQIRHLTLRHHWILLKCGNRFVCGGRARPVDVAFFLWTLSPEYTPNDAAKRDAFIAEKCAAAVSLEWFGEATRAIREYIAGALQDWPEGDGHRRKAYVAPAAHVVDLMGCEYGWGPEVTMEAPMALLIQLSRVIQVRRNPQAPLFNRTDRLIGQWLERRNAAAETGNRKPETGNN
jgi:hypothetical protein